MLSDQVITDPIAAQKVVTFADAVAAVKEMVEAAEQAQRDILAMAKRQSWGPAMWIWNTGGQTQSEFVASTRSDLAILRFRLETMREQLAKTALHN